MRSLLGLSLLGLIGCNSGSHQNSATQDLSRSEQLRYEQYMIQGQLLYRTHCGNCHQDDGTGLGELIPPLSQSDYLLSDQNRTLCIIKYGIEGEMTVNGVSYQQPMPANPALSDIEIAQIATYIYNSWGNEEGYIPVKAVTTQLNTCGQ